MQITKFLTEIGFVFLKYVRAHIEMCLSSEIATVNAYVPASSKTVRSILYGYPMQQRTCFEKYANFAFLKCDLCFKNEQ